MNFNNTNKEFMIPLKSKNEMNEIYRLVKDCKNKFGSKIYGDCQLLPDMYNQLLENQTLISDYLNLIDLNYDNIRCYINRELDSDCLLISDLITSHSNSLKCYTFMSQLNEKFNTNLKVYEFATILDDTERLFYLQNGTKTFYLHDSNHLPSFAFSKLSSFSIYSNHLSMTYYEKIVFERLEPPYDTNCYNYKGKTKSRAQCINNLILDHFLKFNCLPKDYESITYVIKNGVYAELKFSFCNKSVLDKKFEINFKKCRIECNEEFFEISNGRALNDHFIGNEFKMLNNKYITLKYIPVLTFIDLILHFGGLLGLWSGVSLVDLKNALKKFFEKFYSILLNKRIFRKCKTHINCIEKFSKKSYLKVRNLILKFSG
jgi:hypothetical protein